MSKYFPALRLLIFGLALTVASGAIAQSGRRGPKKAPAPVPMPEAAEASVKPAEKPKPALTLIVGVGRPDLFYRASVGNILQGFVERLREHPYIKVDVIPGDYSRAEAIRKAKSETEAYVVLLEVRSDLMRASDDSELLVAYSVFSPGTAKIKASGQTYPNRNRGVILNPRTSGIYGDYRLEQAAREAADRVLKAFHLHPPDRR